MNNADLENVSYSFKGPQNTIRILEQGKSILFLNFIKIIYLTNAYKICRRKCQKLMKMNSS